MRFEPEIAVEGKRRISPLTVIAILVVLGMVGAVLLPSRKSVRIRSAKQTIESKYPLTIEKDIERDLAPHATRVMRTPVQSPDGLNLYAIWDPSKKTRLISDLESSKYMSEIIYSGYLVLVTSTNSGTEYEWSIVFNAFAIQKKNTDLLTSWASFFAMSPIQPSIVKQVRAKYVGLDPEIKKQAEEMLIKNRKLATEFGTSDIYVQDINRKGYRPLRGSSLGSLLHEYERASEK